GYDTFDAGGSTANNVLEGGAGNDNLIAGQGRDLLIGGTGADSLAARGTGDIEIPGTTSYDANLAALNAVMAEWGRTDADYATRVKHLGGSLPGGRNGGYLLTAQTVSDDQATDYLYGNWQALDWFFARTSGSSRDQTNG